MHETARSERPPAPAAAGGGLDEVGLSFEVAEEPDGVVVFIRGELDLASAPEMQRELLLVLARDCRRLTLDLGKVTFLDSSGLGALYGTQQAAEQRGVPLRLVEVPDHVVRVLDVTAMAPLFDVESREG